MKKAFQKLVTCVVMAGVLVTPLSIKPATAAGLPVIDFSNLTQAISYVKQAREQLRSLRDGFSKTIGELRDITRSARKQVEAITGANEFLALYDEFKSLPNLIKYDIRLLISTADPRNYTTADLANGKVFKDIIQKIDSVNIYKGKDDNGKNTSARLSKVKDSLDRCSNNKQYKEEETYACQVKIISGLNNYETNLAYARQIKAQYKELSKLQESASKAKDVKQAQDLQNAILIFQLKNETLQLQLKQAKENAAAENDKLQSLLAATKDALESQRRIQRLNSAK